MAYAARVSVLPATVTRVEWVGFARVSVEGERLVASARVLCGSCAFSLHTIARLFFSFFLGFANLALPAQK